MVALAGRGSCGKIAAHGAAKHLHRSYLCSRDVVTKDLASYPPLAPYSEHSVTPLFKDFSPEARKKSSSAGRWESDDDLGEWAVFDPLARDLDVTGVVSKRE